jgi:hypothetical protein
MRLLTIRLRTMMVVVAMGAVVTLVLLFSPLGVDDAYAQRGAADMVIRFLEEHEGRWPRGWDDLQAYHDQGMGRVTGWTFADFQRHIRIKWDVDPNALAIEACNASRPTFQAIWSANPFGATLGDGPNWQLYEHFRRKRRPAQDETDH